MGFQSGRSNPKSQTPYLCSLCNTVASDFWKSSLARRRKGCLFGLRHEQSPSRSELELIFHSRWLCFHGLRVKVNKDRYVGRKKKVAFVEKRNSRRSILSHYTVNYREQAALAQGLTACPAAEGIWGWEPDFSTHAFGVF